MILQALKGYYDRVAADGDASGVAAEGFAPQIICFALIVGATGEPIDVMDLRERRGNQLRGVLLTVPKDANDSTSNVSARPFWGNSSYVLGVSARSKRSAKEHEAFKLRHTEMLAEATDFGLLALRKFLQLWQPERLSSLRYADEIVDQTIVFRFEGDEGFIHQRAAAQGLWLSPRGADTSDFLLTHVTQSELAACTASAGYGRRHRSGAGSWRPDRSGG